MTDSHVQAGERFYDSERFEDAAREGEHIWKTLGYERTSWQPGATSLQWTATPAYCFPARGGPIVQGGLVTALLDAAMGGACWTVLDRDQAFLTADLRVEFLRPSRAGLLRARGTVIRRTRKVVFCAAEMTDDHGAVLATSRCTQVVLSDTGAAGRAGTPDDDPPRDARG